ncbi:MAG TPA: bifunctional demethylmenaquinone methyltransferase/2-methoxy-6-polyprenyl-1,4-benzoquinol methylase UbiE [Candidatus Saccharimonadia bacterium]|nr:bifunctional demethylmenaquinone methyltransferase/2-methoxy-6-polyprenyl-1,4-benzoquinol methylase UbiE [Candidatus Saccharimonadia bacterium]
MDESKTHFGFRDVAPAEKTRLVREVFASVAPKYDVMNDLMSLGVHRLWKRDFVAGSGVRRGHAVLDLAGGTGDIALLMARAVGDTGRVVLTDINGAMLARGRDRTIDEGASSRIDCVQVDAASIPFPDRSFDLVTIAFGLRNVTDKDAALREMYRVLKIGGRALVLEFSQPRGSALRALYDLYSFEVLPRLGRAVANDAESYRYLAESIRKHPAQGELASLLREAGFERVSYRNLSAGIVAIHSGYRI